MDNDDAPQKSIKILFLGDTGVGKTCILNRIVNDVMLEEPIQTIGFGLDSIVVESREGEKIRVDMWDTAGQEKYRSLTPTYFVNASVAFLVYDITSPESLNELKMFIDLLKDKGPPGCQMVLIGNKTDLDDERRINCAKGEEFKNIHDISYFVETSAKTGYGIGELIPIAVNMPSLLFHTIVKDLNIENNKNTNETRENGDKCC